MAAQSWARRAAKGFWSRVLQVLDPGKDATDVNGAFCHPPGRRNAIPLLFLLYSYSIPILSSCRESPGAPAHLQSVAKRISLLTWIRDLDPAPELPTERLLLRALLSSFRKS